MENESQNLTSQHGDFIDYTDHLKFEPNVGHVRSKYCVLSGNMVTVAFAVQWNTPKGIGIGKIAKLPDDLVLSGAYIPFTGYVDFDGSETQIIACGLAIDGKTIYAQKVPSASGGNNFFCISLTFVKNFKR
ncbi:MAG TPA: hypothetical protein VN040_24880 [Pseudosphingobacterium sp.]|nr:hypothetical protein [Pseudosphingobacterium sp.]